MRYTARSRTLLFAAGLALLLSLSLLCACGTEEKTEGVPAAVSAASEGVYTVRLSEAAAGFTFTFCTGDVCVPVTTGEDGTAVFEGPAAEYEVKLIRSADGYEADFPDVRLIGPESGEILVEIREAAS